MDISLIVSLISGALGGNGAAKVMPDKSLGTLWNSVAGIVGGGLGSQILGMIVPSLGAAAGDGMDIGSIAAQVVGGGVGGGVVMAIIGMIKKAMAK